MDTNSFCKLLILQQVSAIVFFVTA
jgi:hypothetical protein